MATPIKRTRLTAIYLTTMERDLVRHALQHLSGSLKAVSTESLYDVTKFAKSFTAQRLMATAALFADTPADVPKD